MIKGQSENMAKRSVAKNYIFNASYQLMTLIVPLITTPYISRVLQADGIGVYSYTFSIVSYFTLCAALGTATYGNKIFGILQDKPKERTQKFWDLFLLRVIVSSIALMIYLIYAFAIAANKWIAVIQGIYILAMMFDISWYFQGLEEFKKIVIRNYIMKIINIACIFIFVKSASDLWKYIFGLAFLTLAGNLSIWVYLPEYTVKIKKYIPHPFHDINTIAQLFIPSVAIQIYAMLDKSMLGWFTSTSYENGYYEQSGKIVKMCLMLIMSLTTVMIPRISKAFAENRRDDLLESIYASYNFIWFLSIPLMFGIIGITPLFVPVFFGPGYKKVEILLPIFSLMFITLGLNSTTGSQYFITTGQQKIYTRKIVIGGVVNVILNLLLIPRLYSIGAAIGSVIGEIVIIMTELMFIHKNRQFDVRKVFKLSYKYLIAGIPMLVYLLVIGSMLNPTVKNLVIAVFSSALLYFVILLIQREKFVVMGMTIVKNKIRSRGFKI